MRKLGIIAGGGDLPVEVARACEAAGRPFFIVRLRGFADDGVRPFPGADIGLAELGACFSALRREGCETVTFVGNVKRPDFSALKPDFRGIRSLPGAIAAARKGDDALLRFVLGEFEKEGFIVEGAHDAATDLTLTGGSLGSVTPTPDQLSDIRLALDVAKAIGALDIGQGAVVCDGLVLAVEAQEGTDAMLDRCAGLPQALRGAPGAGRGVLAKAPKPIQERRVDLPTIGVATIERAAKAGLAGVVGEVGGVLVLDRPAVVAAADRLGLFVWGVEP